MAETPIPRRSCSPPPALVYELSLCMQWWECRVFGGGGKGVSRLTEELCWAAGGAEAQRPKRQIQRLKKKDAKAAQIQPFGLWNCTEEYSYRKTFNIWTKRKRLSSEEQTHPHRPIPVLKTTEGIGKKEEVRGKSVCGCETFEKLCRESKQCNSRLCCWSFRQQFCYIVETELRLSSFFLSF